MAAQIKRPPTTVKAYLTQNFQRCIVSARKRHFVVDGPAYAGGPQEAIHPTEAFLAGVASCASLMVERLAKAAGYALRQAEVETSALVIPEEQPRDDLTLITELDMHFDLYGVSEEQAAELVKTFKER